MRMWTFSVAIQKPNTQPKGRIRDFNKALNFSILNQLLGWLGLELHVRRHAPRLALLDIVLFNTALGGHLDLRLLKHAPGAALQRLLALGADMRSTLTFITANTCGGAHLPTVDEATHAERGPHMLISKDDPSSLPGKNSNMAYANQLYTVSQSPNPPTPTATKNSFLSKLPSSIRSPAP